MNPLRSSLASGILLAFALAPLAGVAQEPSGPDDAFVGTWEGALDLGGTSLTVVFYIGRGEDGTLTATMDSPDQGATGIPVGEVTREGGAIHLVVDAVRGEYTGTLSEDGGAISGTWSQGPARLPLELTRGDGASAEPARPQEPEPPYPYRTEPVAVENPEAGVTLAGTLTLPPGDGPFPGAVLVSGSGPQDRDETVFGHRPFLVLADYLTRRGIAVLRYDDRGTAESTGTYATATSEDFASDALAAVRHLRADPAVRDDAVGIVGHSEGGLIGPLAATRSSDVAFLVLLAGPGIPGAEILVRQGELIARAQGTPEEVVGLNARLQRRLIDIVRREPDPDAAAPELRAVLEAARDSLPEELRAQMDPSGAIEANVEQINAPWFRFFLRHDPRPTLEEVAVPVLALNGELDLQVPAEVNLREIETALARGGNDDVTVRMLSGLNHLFQKAETGNPMEYRTIPETMNPVALEAVGSWILRRFSSRH